MAYTDDQLPSGLDAITSTDATDVFVVGDATDSNRAKKITKANLVTDLETSLNHDNLAGFVANEHIDHTSVSITAGDGLSGGGTIAATRTLNVDINGATDLAAPTGSDEILVADVDNSNAIRKTDLTTAVDNAGAVMNSDTSTASMSFVIDDDTMATASATTVPTSESVAAFVAAQIAAQPGPETSLDTEPDGVWFTFVQPIPEVSTGTGSNGWTINNAGTFTLSGTYVAIADNGGSGAQIYNTIPTASEYKIKFLVQTNNTSGIFGIGIGESFITPGTNDDGVYFEFDTTSSYEATTGNGTSRTQTAISAVTYTSWTEYVIHYRPGTDARFYVDGTLVATNTTNLPTLTSPGVAFYNESASSQIRFFPVIVSLKY